MATIRIGLSGYAYPEWQGDGLFYPPKLPKAKYLDHYSSVFSTVEGVGMFTRMPAESTAEKCIKVCPPNFQLSPKMHQAVTHFKRLKAECYPIVEDFLKPLAKLEEAGMMGPILVQLPPNFAAKPDILQGFLSALPKASGRRWAFEFRHPSWRSDEVESLLRDSSAATVCEDTDDGDAHFADTADHCYFRLRKTDYSDPELRVWAERIQELHRIGRDCYVYFRHTDVDAPWTWARRLIELV